MSDLKNDLKNVPYIKQFFGEYLDLRKDKDNEEKRYVCSTDYDSLYSECIGSKSDNYTIKEVK